MSPAAVHKRCINEAVITKKGKRINDMRNQHANVHHRAVCAQIKRVVVLVVCLLLGAGGLLSASAQGASQKTVRVGWFDSPFNYKN